MLNPKKQSSRHPKSMRPTPSKLCGRCSKGPHGRDKCPAREAVCHQCKKKGHYNSQCHTKMGANQHSVHSETSIDTAFLDVMTGTDQSSWTVEISLTNHLIQFKLDTGAEVTTVSDQVFSSLCNIKLQKTSKVLLGPARQKLEAIGQFDGHFVHKGETCQHTVFVVKGLKTNLLGLPTIIRSSQPGNKSK